MSCDAGIRCKTCDEVSIGGFNHGHDRVESLLRSLPHIAEAFKVDTTGMLEIRYIGDYDDLLAFALKHREHDLIIEDEYGRIGNPPQEVQK